MTKPSVLVTFDSMISKNCGYFSFGKGLGNAIIQCNKEFDLNYYLFKESCYQFNNDVNIRHLKQLDKFFFTDKNKFDVVHLTDQTCRLRPYKVNAKVILTVHDMNKVHLNYSSNFSINIYLRKLKKFIEASDVVVCISHFVAQDVLKYFPDAKNKIRVIYNGADKLKTKPNHIPNFLPARPFLFTIGLLSKQKGFHHLPALLKDNNYNLVISGIETNHKSVILEEAKKYNCLDRVHITGPICDEDKAWYYENCNAFLFPSIAEGFGLPVIEAMHFGKPVFLSKFTSLPEVGGDVAYYFDNFDPKHMLDVFNEGMQDFKDNNKTEKMIEQANKFTWHKAAQEYLNLYAEVL